MSYKQQLIVLGLAFLFGLLLIGLGLFLGMHGPLTRYYMIGCGVNIGSGIMLIIGAINAFRVILEIREEKRIEDLINSYNIHMAYRAGKGEI
jgi:hypothetical protein